MLACYDRSPILRGGMGDDGYQKEAELDASDRDTDTDATNNEKCDKSSNGPGNCCQWNQDKLGCNNLSNNDGNGSNENNNRQRQQQE